MQPPTTFFPKNTPLFSFADMLSLIFDEDDLPPHHERNIPSHNVLANFLIGASVSLLASCLSSLGVNLQASALKAKREANLVLEDTDDEVSIDTSNLASEQRNTDKYGATSSFSHETSLPIPEGDESYFDGGMGLRGRKVEQPAAAEGRDRESSTTSTRSFVSWFSLESFRSGKSWRFGRHSKESWRDFFAKWQWHLGMRAVTRILLWPLWKPFRLCRVQYVFDLPTIWVRRCAGFCVGISHYVWVQSSCP